MYKQKQYPKALIKRSCVNGAKNGFRIDATIYEPDTDPHTGIDGVLTQLIIRSNRYKL